MLIQSVDSRVNYCKCNAQPHSYRYELVTVCNDGITNRRGAFQLINLSIGYQYTSIT